MHWVNQHRALGWMVVGAHHRHLAGFLVHDDRQALGGRHRVFTGTAGVIHQHLAQLRVVLAGGIKGLISGNLLAATVADF